MCTKYVADNEQLNFRQQQNRTKTFIKEKK